MQLSLRAHGSRSPQTSSPALTQAVLCRRGGGTSTTGSWASVKKKDDALQSFAVLRVHPLPGLEHSELQFLETIKRNKSGCFSPSTGGGTIFLSGNGGAFPYIYIS